MDLVDATNIERNLYLNHPACSSWGIPCVVALKHDGPYWENGDM